MAKRWCLNEDIVVCKHCLENPWAYSSDMDIEDMSAKLKDVGFEPRSESAIRQRAYAYQLLLDGRMLSCVSDQVAGVFEILASENNPNTRGVKSYIREVYRPQESSGISGDEGITSNLISGPSGLLELKRTIDFKSTFPMVLQKYVDLKGIKKHSVMCRSIGMKPDTFSSILRGKYQDVKKDNVLRICVGLKLRVEEAEELLESAGFMFSNAIMTDIVIKAFLWDRRYSVVAINAELYENNAPMLFDNYVIEYEV